MSSAEAHPLDPRARRNPENPPAGCLPGAWRAACAAAGIIEARSRCLGRGRCGRAFFVYTVGEQLCDLCPTLGIERIHAWAALATAPGAAEHARRLIIELRKTPMPDAGLRRWLIAVVRKAVPEVPLRLHHH